MAHYTVMYCFRDLNGSSPCRVDGYITNLYVRLAKLLKSVLIQVGLYIPFARLIALGLLLHIATISTVYGISWCSALSVFMFEVNFSYFLLSNSLVLSTSQMRLYFLFAYSTVKNKSGRILYDCSIAFHSTSISNILKLFMFK